MILSKLPKTDPTIKLEPTMKLMGNFTVSYDIKFTLLVLELFCIRIINKNNEQELNINIRNNFLNWNNIQ